MNTQGKVDSKLRYALNGVSHIDPETPLKLAEYFGVTDKVFKYDSISDNPTSDQIKNIKIEPNVLNITQPREECPVLAFGWLLLLRYSVSDTLHLFLELHVSILQTLILDQFSNPNIIFFH